jgi:hypothetical protein
MNTTSDILRRDLVVRATVPALRRLIDHGATVRPDGRLWHITIRQPLPAGVVMTRAPLTQIRCGDNLVVAYVPALRLETEPKWPGECPPETNSCHE